MPVPILLFAAAGALAGGGLGGSVYLWRKASQKAAADELKSQTEQLADLMKQQIDLAELRQQAQAAGVDVDAVIAGYQALQEGYLSLQEVVQKYLTGEAAVPAESPGTVVPQLESPNVIQASPAEIRAWAKAAGLDVADYGPIPRHILEAYRTAHD